MKTKIKNLIDNGHYEAAAELFAKNTGTKMQILSTEYKLHFSEDKQQRYVFKIRLSHGRKSYTFEFGQSNAKGSEEPTFYDLFSCFQNYDVGSFEDFCSEFGYSEDSRTAERIYKAVCHEYEAMRRLYTENELEIMGLIN